MVRMPAKLPVIERPIPSMAKMAEKYDFMVWAVPRDRGNCQASAKSAGGGQQREGK
jgi:hypothetical protein